MKVTLKISAALLFGTCLALASEPGSFDRTLTVSGPLQLDVRSDPGGIIITSGPDTAVHVHAVLNPLYGRFDLDLAEANIHALERNPPIEQVGNCIRIGYLNDPAVLRGVSMRLEIQTPRGTRVHAHTISGGIRIAGLNGPADTETSSGKTEIGNIAADVSVVSHSGGIIIHSTGSSVSARNESGGIQIVNIHGSVDTQTTSGRTEISEVSGDVRSVTHSGSIRIDNAEGAVTARNTSGNIDAFQLTGSVHAETRSGAIQIGQARPAPIRALTDSGSIRVELASRGGYSIDAQSVSGRVSGPVSAGVPQIAENHHLKEQLDGGGALVDLDTHSSRINIE
ncbi:MAG TPA: DUF4097 family beta strand repeat-containing protein [Bryobacteraceae bacterium]|jgi:DUF4097 and DUF4098 domain-containing protein YvlB|nr:DUF4097 family beta strand repeat-containing protein [Bryobacteraceae bacterium]